MARRGDRSADRRLVDRCLRGEAGGWDELRARYWQPLLEHVRHYVRGQADADTLASEVTEDVWLSLRRPDTHRLAAYDSRRGSLHTFLCALADDRLRQVQRKRRGQRHPPEAPLDFEPAAALDVGPEARDLWDQFVASLPPREQAFVRHELLNEPSPEGWRRPAASARRVLKHRILQKYEEFSKSQEGD